MKTWTLRLGMSLMLVVGFWTNRLPAQEVPVVPTLELDPAHHGPAAYPYYVRQLPTPADHSVRRMANALGMGCKDDYYYPTCGSWRYEARFMFGSCRSFFDQPREPYQPVADWLHKRSADQPREPYQPDADWLHKR